MTSEKDNKRRVQEYYEGSKEVPKPIVIPGPPMDTAESVQADRTSDDNKAKKSRAK